MHNSQYQSVIQALNACAAACDHCYDACLQEQDVKMMARCIRLDRDCSDICKLTASALARNSEVAKTLLQAWNVELNASIDAEACACEEACRSAMQY
ncbi:four-helix bundle copper-binding protein [Rufibacter sp. LB8]|uniref:four-helix bundle copper-binding protein n=1 Tax=Rufibacter sp. LB8 TaxID=2777781 RepID=UPI00178C5482|nr:four-helix bundle copper-binding protein [Rufibacter sp. LB8]